MFEARLNASATLKKVLDSIKDLLNEATFDCSDSGIQVKQEKLSISNSRLHRNSFPLITAASYGQFSCLIGFTQSPF
jgi:DNA polymerase III sliding clamp (beta) subunit (PCNA family)